VTYFIFTRNDFREGVMMKKLLFILLMVCMQVSLFAGGGKETDLAKEGTPTGKLEIFSWWAGDEGPALDALVRLYEKKYPDVEVLNATVAGGSGVNAKAVLKTRMLGGNPPDTFQVHAGQELIGTWVVAERMEDLTTLFKKEGWNKAFPKDLVNLLGTKEGIWSVPVNIHRSNVLWYVPDNIQKWGVKVPESWDDFFKTAEVLKTQGIVPLALATNWTVMHLWESIALATLGADDYAKLWNASLAFDDPKAKKIWDVLDKVLQYTNKDASSLSWQQAMDMVVSGKAAFNIMGDWAAGYMATTLNLKPGMEFAWNASPGTKGVFMFLADSFGLPVGAPNKTAAVAWLRLIGSREGSDAFNPLKGSISARRDSDLSLYNAYGQSAAKSFQKDRIVGSLTHGVVSNENFMSGFSNVLEGFLKDRNTTFAAQATQSLASDTLLRK